MSVEKIERAKERVKKNQKSKNLLNNFENEILYLSIFNKFLIKGKTEKIFNYQLSNFLIPLATLNQAKILDPDLLQK